MSEPPSPTVGAAVTATVVGADEQTPGADAVAIDVDRWCRLARDVLTAEGRGGELTLTFVDRAEIAALNEQHLGKPGPTDVLSFPLDAREAAAEAPGGAVPNRVFTPELPGPASGSSADEIPVLLGDVVVCPAVARDQAPTHAGSLDDELALLVVHGVLHVLGRDHAEPDEAAEMWAKERELLTVFHWGGPPPLTFEQEHRES